MSLKTIEWKDNTVIMIWSITFSWPKTRLLISFLAVFKSAWLVSKDLRLLMNKAIKSKVSLVTSLFLAWALLSYFYALNPTEVIVRIFTMVNFYLLFLNLSVILAYNKFTKIQISLHRKVFRVELDGAIRFCPASPNLCFYFSQFWLKLWFKF